MTTFKEKLDQELGEAPRFTQSLQQDILQRVQQEKKVTKRWSYPLIFIGAILILLLLVEMGPLGQMEQTRQASIVTMAQQETVKKYTMISNSDEETFLAGRPGWTIGQKVYKQIPEKELLQQLLQQATVTQKYEENQFLFRTIQDVWAQFENDQIIKLKMFIGEESILIEDHDHKSFYKVNNRELTKAYENLTLKDQAKFGMKGYVVFLVLLLAIHMLVEKIMRKRFNIPKGYVSRGHRRAVWTLKALNIVMLILFMVKGWILYTVIIGGYLTVILFSSIFIDYCYGREEKRHYLSISLAIVSLLLLSLFIFYIS
ncbi:DUF4181 domain-containing protein [Lysinibacillus sp. FW12]|uniref:DUF4181 domain-containing protein n=1 Tax=Lysinibacillus sp. FW12 TaxID=3096079 RepID=UPI003D73EBFC